MNLRYLFIFCLCPVWLMGQWTSPINFEDSNYLDLIIIDTLSNPNNIWQIGKPQKVLFDSAQTSPNAIITDTVNTYPINDTSSFYLWHTNHLTPYNWPALLFNYKIDSDSLYDFGKIEFSTDKGVSWYSLADTNLPYNLRCSSCKDLFTGNSGSDWLDFGIAFVGWDDYFGYTDSILFKFTFYSDGIHNDREGWMIDNIFTYDYYMDVQESNNVSQINITPNPAQETIRIQFLDPNIRDAQELKIYSITGQLVLHQMTYPPESEINIEMLESGVYMYIVGDQRGKMVVE
ncbi:T9SS type A sorting domain-containing protein [bacterium SCSIO 12643]|nr:T9SS type A sorting domain-containing protein [bacterium SCSIO 12643]